MVSLLLSLVLTPPVRADGERNWSTVSESARALSNPDCRVALVIGNATYSHATDVDNAARDARAVAALLGEPLGFEVVSGVNLDGQAQRDLVQRFIARVQPGCVALVYYAGHAVQGSGGFNYLLPVDMRGDDAPVPQAVHLQAVLAQLEEREAVVRLAFLDACRTLVFDGDRGNRSTTLAPVQGTGLLVAYAASPGQVAGDGPAGGHSPFTAAFLEYAARPGLRVEQVFDGIQDAVSPTGQAPHGSDLLSGAFYFLPPEAPAHATAAAPATPRPAGARMVTPSGVALRWVPPTGPEGYTMGSPRREPGRGTDEDRVRVVLRSGLWVMESEVSRWMYRLGLPPEEQPDIIEDRSHPWERLSWCDAVAFANRLSQAEGLAPAYALPTDFSAQECTPDLANTAQPIPGASGYRLLTEAEWEWAARAGAPTRYAGGDDPVVVAWFRDNAGRHSHPACTRAPNAWGLCDMSGNVWEWVQDAGAPALPGGGDPVVRAGPWRVIRGGSFTSSESRLRVADRSGAVPPVSQPDLGFRLARPE